MSKKELIRKRMCEILEKDLSELHDDARFANLGVESFALVNMIIDLQETFKLRLNQEDLITLHTVGDLITLVNSRI